MASKKNKSAEHETPVIFRVWPKSEGGGVIALFPTCPAQHQGYSVDSYEHIGQHGSADLHGVIGRTRLATPQEYAALKRELEATPYKYKLKVYTRATRGMLAEMLREQHAMRRG